MLLSIIVPLAAFVHIATAGVISSSTLTSLSRRAVGSPVPGIQDGTGKATYYGGGDGGNCAFQGWTPPAGLQGIAIGAGIWDNSAHCGGCVEISYNGGPSQYAVIVDQCPECPNYHIDMWPGLFSKFAPLRQGIIQGGGKGLNWKSAPCPGSLGPLAIRVKEGTSQWWFSAQVRNTKDETAKMEIQLNGKWQAMVRQSANYFNADAGTGGAQSVSIRVTSVHGVQVVVPNVPTTGGTLVTGSKNYS